eukprot:GHVR01042777.1.p1 GENE.GHVR01042777.1~~GHVR01042777.1.p1  ORF type:complete len:135 (-),score=34.08 GHVR01042777.1:2-406(-)
MTMKKLLNISSSGINAMITSANWLRQELPVRIAHRLYDFHRQPYVVMRNPHIEEVYNIYVETFEKVTTFPLIDCSEDLKKFSTFLTEQVDCHSSTGHISCVCVCVCVCIYVCVYLCIYRCLCACVCIYTQLFIN